MNSDIHNKVEIAIEQLETALKLFIAGDSYVSALTLGGAAEEILGMALTINDIENSLKEQYKFYNRPGLKWVFPPTTWKKFTTDGKNKFRNSVKHLSGTGYLTFEADIQGEAVWMLVRAMDNYNRLGFKPTDLIMSLTCGSMRTSSVNNKRGKWDVRASRSLCGRSAPFTPFPSVDSTFVSVLAQRYACQPKPY